MSSKRGRRARKRSFTVVVRWSFPGPGGAGGRFRHDGAVGEAQRLGERELPRLAAGASVSWCPSPAVNILFHRR